MNGVSSKVASMSSKNDGIVQFRPVLRARSDHDDRTQVGSRWRIDNSVLASSGAAIPRRRRGCRRTDRCIAPAVSSVLIGIGTMPARIVPQNATG